jgi:hypothetical protein
MNNPPKIENAPGLKWRQRRSGWSARWQARDDLVERGYEPKQMNLYFWKGEEMTRAAIAHIQHRCETLQAEMLVWGRGGVPKVSAYDKTVQSLVDCYMTDELSSYREVRFHTRKHYQALCRVLVKTKWKEDDDAIERTAGETLISEIKARHIKRWHRSWTDGGKKIPMGHAVIGMLRSLVGFGVTILEDEECIRLAAILHALKFPMGKSRDVALTTDQVTAIRERAREKGLPSIALAQAAQYEFTWRQKDLLGEWVPMSEPGSSDITTGNEKWLRGLRWNEVDETLCVHHVTSKRLKLSEPEINFAPMVIEELNIAYPGFATEVEVLVAGKLEKRVVLNRDLLPPSGPVIVSEVTGLPWTAQAFRRAWRSIANECGIPKNVRNMDTRAGAITEAFDADAPGDKVRKTATHSNIIQTNKYSRGDAKATADVMQIRAAARVNKTGRNTG